jgi:hypothetical protein
MEPLVLQEPTVDRSEAAPAELDVVGESLSRLRQLGVGESPRPCPLANLVVR